jgi:hypothetical protein
VGIHLVAGPLETILTEAFKIDALLPVCAGLAVDPAGVPMVRFTNERNIHSILLCEVLNFQIVENDFRLMVAVLKL